MSAPTMYEPAPAANGPESPPKPPRQRKPAQQAPQQEQPAPRRIKRRAANSNRAYYVCSVSLAGTIDRMVRKFPTVGQARKNLQMVAEVAGIAPSQAKIARVIIVE